MMQPDDIKRIIRDSVDKLDNPTELKAHLKSSLEEIESLDTGDSSLAKQVVRLIGKVRDKL